MSALRFEALGREYNRGWRVAGVVGVVLAVFGGVQVAVGAGVYVWERAHGRAPAEDFLDGLHPLFAFTLVNLSALSILVGLLSGVRLVTRQPLLSLFTAAPAPRWRRFAVGGATTAMVTAAVGVAEAIASPGSLQAPLPWADFWPAFGLALVLTPLQCLAEELCFRGFLLQLVSGRRARVRLAVCVSTTLFAAGHLPNPEARAGGWLYSVAVYGGFGLVLSLLAVREQGIELGWGVHTANNLFGLLVLSECEEASLLKLPALVRATHFDPWLSALPSLVVVCLVGLLTQWLIPARRVEAGGPLPDAESA
jgi:uncharacterized protein